MTGPGGSGDFIQLPKSVLVWAMARSVGIVVAYLAAYFVVPWTVLDGWGEVVVVAAFLVVAALTAVWQIGRILRAPAPAVQAIEALAIIAPLYLLGFSLGYFMLSASDPAQFSEPLSRMSSLYFTLSVFATVGFGDITAAVDLSRAIVAAQMVLNLIVVGVGIKVIVAAVQWSRAQKKESGGKE
ncbi:ion channel [Williamsia muralis]|uniref:Ion channel family protein n=1 Tax=Williamsia marianensis TaxID=85044 RepID=A0A2G3PJF3_WILMA|nr:ion channel [Williamsia marianensis]PHV65930.1 ion channel family protein [Williamsia marianensis]PZT97442.1 MAG: two pore domain potassium channel family protein [Gordonia sp. (in: high G+C Gram-positive bacteria)]